MVALVSIRDQLAERKLYLSWTGGSSVLLAVSGLLDPYVFAFTALGAAWLSGVLMLGALVWGRRQLPWAVAGAIPTAVSFLALSGYKWA